MDFAIVENRKIRLTKTQLAIILAVLAVIQAAVTAGTGTVLEWSFPDQLETAKLELERRKAAAELYRAALSNSDPSKRHQMVAFLIKAKLVDENDYVVNLSADALPQWPAP